MALSARSLIPLFLVICLANANIEFKHAKLPCNPTIPANGRCMRGQICSPYGICEPSRGGSGAKRPLSVKLDTVSSPYSISPEKLPKASTRQLLVDAVIGSYQPEFGARLENLIHETSLSELNGESLQGEQKTSHTNNAGFLGLKLDDTTAETLRRVGEPSLRPAPSAKPSDGPVKVTVDGHCGSGHENSICAGWKSGECCSAFGFCGNTTSHCGYGCQSGPCLGQSFLKPLDLPSYPARYIAGTFDVVGRSGVPPMMAALLQNGRVVFADKVENYTEITWDNGRYAYSTEYDPVADILVPLTYKTNAFCSGGAILADGRVLSVGGNGPLKWMDPTVDDGFRGIRYLERRFDDDSFDGSSWKEPGHILSSPRWYPSVQVLPDGRVFVASGSLNGDDPSKEKNNNPTYELLDREGYPYGDSITLSILERNQPYYMYPFIHLLKDGSLFIFVSKSAEIFDVGSGETIRTLPDLPGDYRTYPNTGGSVLLPLRSSNDWEPEVMICGGGAYQDLYSPSDPTCGRIRPLSDNPKWRMEVMPAGRTMGEGILLLDGSVLWINGCSTGAQGYGVADNPVYEPWIYRPRAARPKRWSIGGTSFIPRMYHSVALLLLDGTVLVAGSNPIEQPLLVANPDDPALAFPTEFRVEIYTPHYLLEGKAEKRPEEVTISSRYLAADGGEFEISFVTHRPASKLQIVLYEGGFVTHSVHMGHRMIYLDHHKWRPWKKKQKISVNMPPDSNIAPPGAYVIFVVVDGVPSEGQFVMVE